MCLVNMPIPYHRQRSKLHGDCWQAGRDRGGRSARERLEDAFTFVFQKAIIGPSSTPFIFDGKVRPALNTDPVSGAMDALNKWPIT